MTVGREEQHRTRAMAKALGRQPLSRVAAITGLTSSNLKACETKKFYVGDQLTTGLSECIIATGTKVPALHVHGASSTACRQLSATRSRARLNEDAVLTPQNGSATRPRLGLPSPSHVHSGRGL